MDVPDDPVKLQQGFLACRTCGIATRIDSEVDVIEVESLGRAVEGPAAMTMAASENQQTMSLSFGLCPSCRRIADLAERLVSDPSAQPLKASLYPLNCALDALAFIAPGLTPPWAGGEVRGDVFRHRPGRADDHAPPPGPARVRLPLGLEIRAGDDSDADHKRCAPYRFAHVMGQHQQHQQLRTATPAC
jgi:hypothetical protein